MKLIDGYTLMHEHVTIDLSGMKKDEDCRLDCFEETIKEFKNLYEYGVRNVLEVTNIGMGRNVKYIRSVSEESGINIIVSTGFYKEPFLPDFVYKCSINELAEIMERELTQGIGLPDGVPGNEQWESRTEAATVYASVIGEVGTSNQRMTDVEQKVFEAAAMVAVRTGAPITTHTTLGTMGMEQADFLIEHGVEPKKIIIGHMDLSRNVETVLSVLRRGVNVGFDTVGKLNYCPDTFRAEALKRIDREGMLSQVVLSMDITRKSHLKGKGGIGYMYLFDTFLPMLRESGFTKKQIEMLLQENPRRILS